MKSYKVLRNYKPVGKAGDIIQLEDDKFTQSMLDAGMIQETKVVEPEEKKTRKPRAKKKD